VFLSESRPEAARPHRTAAFGSATQSLLRNLRIGIVELGGTGSPLAEQLYRLGVGQLLLIRRPPAFQ
jgi:molybdopterin/thiamine biosynthesis adenylyltransferase